MKNEKPNDPQSPFSHVKRCTELMKEGLSFDSASTQAYLEQQIAHWPEEWNDNLEFLIYGDFQPPIRQLVVEPLGIVVYPETQEHWLFKSARTILRATVKVAEKTIDGIIDAAKRINILLGARTLVAWGNEAIGWWSQITHYPGRSGFGRPFDVRSIAPTIESFLHLREEVHRKVAWAMFWTYAAKQPFQDIGPSDAVFRRYTAYWNAFECLVDATLLSYPMSKVQKNVKQKQIDKFVLERGGKLTAQDIENCYRTIVNPGFVRKAQHSLKNCFEEDAGRYITECFAAKDPKNNLYDIRNSINHAETDPSDYFEIARVQKATSRLHIIIWRMFGQILQFDAPDDKDGKFGVPLDEYTFKQHRG